MKYLGSCWVVLQEATKTTYCVERVTRGGQASRARSREGGLVEGGVLRTNAGKCGSKRGCGGCGGGIVSISVPPGLAAVFGVGTPGPPECDGVTASAIAGETATIIGSDTLYGVQGEAVGSSSSPPSNWPQSSRRSARPPRSKWMSTKRQKRSNLSS